MEAKGASITPNPCPSLAFRNGWQHWGLATQAKPQHKKQQKQMTPMKSYSLTRITIGHTYGDPPQHQYQRNASLNSPQTHQPVNKVFIGDLRDLIESARFVIRSLEEGGLKPSGLTKLKEQLETFNLDGPVR